jgi:hypothetical protein
MEREFFGGIQQKMLEYLYENRSKFEAAADRSALHPDSSSEIIF